jgi:hypothetical protein
VRSEDWTDMKFVLPVVAMVLFSGLFTFAYIWMRRESFGDKEPTSSASRAVSEPPSRSQDSDNAES